VVTLRQVVGRYAHLTDTKSQAWADVVIHS